MKIMYNDKVVSNTITTYETLQAKPMINSVELRGNVSSAQINMYNKSEVDNMFASMRSIKVVEELPETPTANTMYYVGSTHPYHVYLYDNMRMRIDLGESDTDMTMYQRKEDDELQTVSHTVVGGINEVNTNVGKLSTLTTTSKLNTVAAINEVNALAKTKKDMVGFKHPWPVTYRIGGTNTPGQIAKLFTCDEGTGTYYTLSVIFSIQWDFPWTDFNPALFGVTIYWNRSSGRAISNITISQITGGNDVFLDTQQIALCAARSSDEKSVTIGIAFNKGLGVYSSGTCTILSAGSKFGPADPGRITIQNAETIYANIAEAFPGNSFFRMWSRIRTPDRSSLLTGWAWLDAAKTSTWTLADLAKDHELITTYAPMGKSQLVNYTLGDGTNSVTYFTGNKASGNTYTGCGYCVYGGKSYVCYALKFNSASQVQVYYQVPGATYASFLLNATANSGMIMHLT